MKTESTEYSLSLGFFFSSVENSIFCVFVLRYEVHYYIFFYLLLRFKIDMTWKNSTWTVKLTAEICIQELIANMIAASWRQFRRFQRFFVDFNSEKQS